MPACLRARVPVLASLRACVPACLCAFLHVCVLARPLACLQPRLDIRYQLTSTCLQVLAL
eukprot:3506817-Alexandrium_andersonii.AAC.1